MLEVTVGLSINVPLRGEDLATISRKLTNLIEDVFRGMGDRLKCTIAYHYSGTSENPDEPPKVNVNLIAIRTASWVTPDEMNRELSLGVLYTTQLKESVIPDFFQLIFDLPPESIEVSAILYRKI